MLDSNQTPFHFTLTEVAQRLGVCERTIKNRMRRTGDCSHLVRKIGRRWRFSDAVFVSDIALGG